MASSQTKSAQNSEAPRPVVAPGSGGRIVYFPARVEVGLECANKSCLDEDGLNGVDLVQQGSRFSCPNCHYTIELSMWVGDELLESNGDNGWPWSKKPKVVV